ncbi:hypothetical protein DXT99_01655 [Pontibacter diazotrophicus]|uniref:STAS/SEC14 domain-containing protein n=1 Tax=Pontibacter diazotrophicus TaxID=1400979 RepID=A0A3D8LIJ9_9BACT|nr:hypothetical protein [Pontibacter diazotrophicus]RDV17235.1 hypothetical protein DXT99_01655 [Pontibacter diazotrophicus]
MPFDIKYATDFYMIEVDLDADLLQAKWLRPVSVKEMEAGGTKLYEVLRDTQVARVLANAQDLGVLPAEAKEWMSSRFYELLSLTQLKKMARVLPENLFHRVALESVVTRADALGVTKFDVRNFSSPKEALRWLDS